MLTVVGIGPGATEYLTLQAHAAINEAQILVGGARQLALFADIGAETRLLDSDLDGLISWLRERLDKRVVVLASGDPLVYGIGKRLAANFPPEQLRIMPGISSIQYLCAKAAVDMNDLWITSSHGREPDFNAIAAHQKVAMVTDQIIDPYAIAQAMLMRGLNPTLIIGENLSSADERIHRLPASDVAQSYAMNVVVILNER
ncbi:cobalt-precorrin-6y C5-methyltransferase [Buttiauxella ferragutiae ATCC 51602]|jgi:cobalt-precorrin-7 (C5)-methyltransferase|uniref:Cobalt-precorrin-6y C5-methyltransferase n=1 Tax=Buttiauxella ferragutiae ATCC 51602 TaxID=1354252 RepID=A0ABX2W7L9_9ENTR|nr:MULTISPECIES: cobalt-precorrin-7 (C(5))-methyltransferase [Buttiauxella]MCE0826727.1 cobalt-precorrin-7 (C(5))-methyltransferase [Buttiauxella ferragutiae]OAT26996.1 cobalt-precorrin-6y C5-methyltransferase [Buttiauxella ferragutiae ATCC 51602]TDN55068.1 precorrin-6Y C5,15-methyltransferase (decarboxylating) [Buttiauxella sp. JUb87]UNK62889.1 cobalt-precorrin-7 (C(5))-methyltransferase [Buttiauxella ferragutiae]